MDGAEFTVKALGGTVRGVGSVGVDNCVIAVDDETDTVGVCGGELLAEMIQWGMARGYNRPQIYGGLIEEHMCHDNS